MNDDARVNWSEPSATELRSCPVCGAGDAKKAILQTSSLAPGRGTITLLRCASCTNLFWDDLEPFAYEEGTGYPWSTGFYVEQGAGVDALIEPIARISANRVRRYLELGCGYGFSIDAARRLFDWQCLGLDPSPLGRAGRHDLEIDVRPIYATTDIDLGGKFELVYASEVIEHVGDPRKFLEICAAHLAPGGVLALTTPDAGSITSDMPLAELMLALSPGHHLVLYSADGLRHLLNDAGFETVSVQSRGHRLVAYASHGPLDFDTAAPLDRSLYRRYLSQVLERGDLAPSLRRGLTYRLLKEWTNAADYNAARELLLALSADIRRAFDIAVDAPISAETLSCIRSGAITGRFGAPWCLAGILYCAGMIAQNGTDEPAVAVERFDAAALVAGAFRQAYASIGIDDGETAAIELDAPFQALLSLCRVDPSGAVARLGDVSPSRSGEIRQAIVFCLIDLGHLELAVSAGAAMPALHALAQGFVALHRFGDGKDALALFDRAATAGGQIGARAREGMLPATHQAILSASKREIGTLIAGLFDRIEAPSAGLAPIMLSLVDLGQFEAADRLDGLIAGSADWRLSNARGMLALLHHQRPDAAAAFFGDAWTGALAAGAEADPATRCRIKHHEVLARLVARDERGAATAAAELLGPDAPLWVNDAAKAALTALLADQPGVRRLMGKAGTS